MDLPVGRPEVLSLTKREVVWTHADVAHDVHDSLKLASITHPSALRARIFLLISDVPVPTTEAIDDSHSDDFVEERIVTDFQGIIQEI